MVADFPRLATLKHSLPPECCSDFNRADSYTITADGEINEEERPRYKVGFQTKFRKELKLGCSSGKHIC